MQNQRNKNGEDGVIHVLLVEDNPINQKVMGRMIDSLGGATVEAVDSGEAAIGKLEAESFDLVFMDLQLDGMDGIQTTEEIRKMRSAATDPKVPVIMLSGYSDRASEERARSAGADEYVLKPVDPDRLAEILERVRSASI